MNTRSTLPRIAIDVGNSGLKLGIPTSSDNGQSDLAAALAHVVAIPIPQPSSATSWASACSQHLHAWVDRASTAPLQWCVVSVNGSSEERLAAWVRKHRPDDQYSRLHHGDLPLQVAVQSVEQVGMDRLAAAAAVNGLRPPNCPAIVVDAGTAITVDLISADGTFQGGAILPGLRASADALAQAAEALPRIESLHIAGDVVPVGKTTEQAIRSGLVWGGVGAVKELILQFNLQLAQKATVYCTGGAGPALARRLGQVVHVDEHLVLRGALLGRA